MPLDLDELLDQAVSGDRDALAQLLGEHVSHLRADPSLIISRRWQSLLTIDDVIQQTFTDAVLDIRRFVPRPDASFSGWLHTIARRNLQDAIRMLGADKRGGGREPLRLTDPSQSYDGLFEQLLDGGATPSRHVARREIHAALEEAIESLPADHQIVIRSYDLEGQTIDSVATALNRTPGATFMLRARALRWLREILGRTRDFFDSSRE